MYQTKNFRFILTIPIVNKDILKYYHLTALPIFVRNNSDSDSRNKVTKRVIKIVRKYSKTHLCDQKKIGYPANLHMKFIFYTLIIITKTAFVIGIEIRNLEFAITLLASTNKNKLTKTCNQEKDNNCKMYIPTYMIKNIEIGNCN